MNRDDLSLAYDEPRNELMGGSFDAEPWRAENVPTGSAFRAPVVIPPATQRKRLTRAQLETLVAALARQRDEDARLRNAEARMSTMPADAAPAAPCLDCGHATAHEPGCGGRP